MRKKLIGNSEYEVEGKIVVSPVDKATLEAIRLQYNADLKAAQQDYHGSLDKIKFGWGTPPIEEIEAMYANMVAEMNKTFLADSFAMFGTFKLDK